MNLDNFSHQQVTEMLKDTVKDYNKSGLSLECTPHIQALGLKQLEQEKFQQQKLSGWNTIINYSTN